MSRDSYAECGACGHYPAYHDKEPGGRCRAWNPDTSTTECECEGWTTPAFTATTLICDTTSVAVEPS